MARVLEFRKKPISFYNLYEIAYDLVCLKVSQKYLIAKHFYGNVKAATISSHDELDEMNFKIAMNPKRVNELKLHIRDAQIDETQSE